MSYQVSARNNNTLTIQSFNFLFNKYAEFFNKKFIYLCLITLCILIICINIYVYINDCIDHITYILNICNGNLSLNVLVYAYISSYITKYLHNLLVNTKYYHICKYIVKQEKIKKTFLFFVYIYYTSLNYIKSHFNSLTYLYLATLIVVYNAPLLISLIYMLSAVSVLYFSLILFIYINYINLKFKDNNVIIYNILSIASIVLFVLAFLSLCSHYVIIYNTIKTYIRKPKDSSNQRASLRPLKAKPSNTEGQPSNNNKPQHHNNDPHWYSNEKKKEEQQTLEKAIEIRKKNKRAAQQRWVEKKREKKMRQDNIRDAASTEDYLKKMSMRDASFRGAEQAAIREKDRIREQLEREAIEKRMPMKIDYIID